MKINKINGNVEKIRLPIQHLPNESAAPAVAFASVSALTILESSLSAWAPPTSVLFNVAGTYLLYPYVVPFDDNLVSSAYFVNVLQGTVLDGAFNRVTLSSGNEVGSISAAYFRW